MRNAILAVADEYDRLSVRQLFYQLVARGVIDKTESTYKRVCDVSVQLRMDGSLDYRTIADGHRARRLTYAHSNMQEAMVRMHSLYRRNYWLEQPEHVEVWCEKDALTGVIHPVCDAYGVPYVATRGFPSLTLLYESAQALLATGKPATIFCVGDHDASGQMISANLEGELRRHEADVTVQRLALNPDQVRRYGLPTRPGKRTDSRHARFAVQFGDASVELDALPPDVLTSLVVGAIESAIDLKAWIRAEAIEELEKETLASVAGLPLTPGLRYNLGGETA